MNAKVAGIIRHTLTFAAGILLTTGTIHADQAQAVGQIADATTSLIGATGQQLIGAGFGIAGALWSIFAPEKKAP